MSQQPISGPSFFTGNKDQDIAAMKTEIMRLQEQVRAILGIQGSAPFQKPIIAPQSQSPPDNEVANVGTVKKLIAEATGVILL